MSQKKIFQRGFALLEVLLAVIVISMITFGSYQLIASYRNSIKIQSFQSDLTSIAESYAPILDQSAVSTDTQIKSGKLSSSFLLAVPIAKTYLTDPTIGHYSYVKTALSSGNGTSNLGFAVLTPNQGSTEIGTQPYFVAGVKASYPELSKILQTMNGSFGIFYGTHASLENATPATTLPQCDTQNCIYNVYFVSPKIEIARNQFSSDFTAP